jgi:hypothetical protein
LFPKTHKIDSKSTGASNRRPDKLESSLPALLMMKPLPLYYMQAASLRPAGKSALPF